MELGIQSLFYLLTESNLSEEGISTECEKFPNERKLSFIYVLLLIYLFVSCIGICNLNCTPFSTMIRRILANLEYYI